MTIIRTFSVIALRSVVLGTTLLAAVACTSTPPAPSSGAGATTGSATPTPTIDRRAELKAMVDAAGPTLKDLGVTQPPTEETVLKLTMPCNAPLTAGPVASHSWSSTDAKSAVVSHEVFAYDPQPGSAVVDQIRPALAACKNWTWGSAWELTVVGEFAITRPDGVDNSVGYCHFGTILTGAGKGDKAYLCAAAVSRGHLVTTVGTLKSTLAGAQADLVKALPAAAAALVRAVPAP
jgi:hypothetical protein